MQAYARNPSRESIVGQRLVALLKKRRLSLSEVARRSGVSVSQLSLLTTGQIRYPRIHTIQAICAALGVADSLLTGNIIHQTRSLTDLRALEGVTLVSVVIPRPGGELAETGQSVAIASSELEGRTQVYVAIVEGGGMTPHVLPRDRVVFDPDAPTENEQLVLLLHGASTMAAWRFIRADRQSYCLSDGSWLEDEQVNVLGTIIYIMRQPPRFHAP